jgi:hypothetical protein
MKTHGVVAVFRPDTFTAGAPTDFAEQSRRPQSFGDQVVRKQPTRLIGRFPGTA